MTDIASLQIKVDASQLAALDAQLKKTRKEILDFNSANAKTEGQVLRARAAQEAYTLSQAKAAQRTEQLAQKQAQLAKQNTILARSYAAATKNISLLNIQTALTFVGLGALIQNIVHSADSFARLEARLNMVSGATVTAREQLAGVMSISQRLGTSFEVDAAFYTKMAQATQQYGLSTKELLSVQEALSTSFILSGADSVEAAQGIRQLGQAFSKGKLDGDEFRTVMETNLVLKQKMEEKFGSGADLWAASESGLITINDLIKVLQSNFDEFQKAYDKMPRTVGQEIQRIKNDFAGIFGQSGAGSLQMAFEEMHKTLTDPQVMQGLTDLAVLLIDAAGAAVSLASTLGKVAVGTGQLLLEKQIEMTKGAIEMRKNMNQDTKELEENLKDLLSQYTAYDKAVIEGSRTETKELSEVEARWQGIRKAVEGADKAYGALSGRTTSLPKAFSSKDFEKFEEDKRDLMTQQEKLGKSGEALYWAEGLEKFKEYEREYRLALARRYTDLKLSQDAIDESKKAEEELRDAAEKTNREYRARVESLLGATDAGQMEKLIEDQKFLNDLSVAGTNDAIKKAQALKSIAEQIQDLKNKNDPFFVDEESKNDPNIGFGRAAEEDAKVLEQAYENAFKNIQDSMAEFLFDPFKGGTEEMLKDFGVMLQKMVAQAAAAQIMSGLFGTPDQNFTGGWFGQGLSMLGMGGAGASNSGLSIPSGASFDLSSLMFDKGGMIPSGGFGIVGEYGPEIVSGPANVTSRKDTAKMMGGISSNVTINVSGNAAAQDITTAAAAASKQIMNTIQRARRYG